MPGLNKPCAVGRPAKPSTTISRFLTLYAVDGMRQHLLLHEASRLKDVQSKETEG